MARASAAAAAPAAPSPTSAGRTVPNTASGVAPGVVIPDEDDEAEGMFQTEAEAVANSQVLGASVHGAPVGMPRTVRIILEEAAGDEIPPTGLPVSLNGRAYLIRPGEEVNVPPGVVEILNNAVMSVPVKDPQTMKVIGYRNRLRFPYRRV